jgi:hypothetical protein
VFDDEQLTSSRSSPVSAISGNTWKLWMASGYSTTFTGFPFPR